MEMKLVVPTITAEHMKHRQTLVIDVRTPLEFQRFRIPGAVNIPIFSNEERIQVGTTYKRVGKEDAKVMGLAFFSKKLSSIYAQIKVYHDRYPNRLIVVHCWRGGMRSKSMVTMLSTLGLPVVQLQGGIRAYRQLIEDQLTAVQAKKKPFIVLTGNTGTGKTEILARLSEKGYPVIDLEALANHRGSIFGHIGKTPASQKQFEEKLARRFQELADADYYIIEAESRRIGNVQLPEFMVVGKENGITIQVEADLSFRVTSICASYQIDKYLDSFIGALSSIEKRLPTGGIERLAALKIEQDIPSMVELLLTEYYDPRYQYSMNQSSACYEKIHINTNDDGVEKVEAVIKEICEEYRFSLHANKMDSVY